MRLSDIAEARAKWAKKHGKSAKRLLVPENLVGELDDLCAELLHADSRFPVGRMMTLMGMTVQLTPTKNGELDFA